MSRPCELNPHAAMDRDDTWEVYDRTVTDFMQRYGIPQWRAIVLAHLSRPDLACAVFSCCPTEVHGLNEDAPEPAAYLLSMVAELFTTSNNDTSPEYEDFPIWDEIEDGEVWLWDAVAETCRRNRGLVALVEKKYPGFRCWRYPTRRRKQVAR